MTDDLEARFRVLNQVAVPPHSLDEHSSRPTDLLSASPRSSGARSAPWWAAAAVLVVVAALGALAVVNRDSPEEPLASAGSPTTVAADPAPLGLLPPMAIADLDLQQVIVSGSSSISEPSGGSTDGSSDVSIDFGDWVYRGQLAGAHRTVVYQFGEEESLEVPNAAPVLISFTTPATADQDDVEGPGETEAEWLVGDDIRLADLGESCDVERLLISGYARAVPCEFRAIGLTEGGVIEISSEEEVDLESLLETLQMADLDSIRAALSGIPGAEGL